MKFRVLTALLLPVFMQTAASGQELSYTDARTLTLTGKANNDTCFYYRIDTLKYNNMPASVKRLLTNTSGMAIAFRTNSNIIGARWKIPAVKNHINMTPIVHSGLDLYIKLNGKWTYAGSGGPKELSNEAVLVKEMESGEKECLLYLPLYNGIEQLEIGVTKGSTLMPLQNPFIGKVVVYGSSITQGASASRPGLAYPSQLSRSSGIHFINLGVSGSGKMEPEVADMVADIEADAYVLDCAANPGAKEITERTFNFVQKIRTRHPHAPIIMIQSVIREGGTFNIKIRETVAAQNNAFKEEYQKLINAGIKNLYLIESVNFLGTDHEGTIDGTHPTDVGFNRFLDAITPKLLSILTPVIGEK